jgi:hypothetical protein
VLSKRINLNKFIKMNQINLNVFGLAFFEKAVGLAFFEKAA